MPIAVTKSFEMESAREFAEGAFRLHKTRRLSHAVDTSILEVVAEEVPVTLIYNDLAHATFLTTPVDLVDFARGFSLTDGIVHHRDEIADISIFVGEDGFEARLYIAPSRFGVLQETRHKILTRGRHGLSGVRRAIRRLPYDSFFSEAAISAAYQELPKLQVLNMALGSLQATGFANASGKLLEVREDIRRHNAFDKAAGAIMTSGHVFRECFAIITSNCSFDMVEKAASIGVPMIVGQSSPSSLAIRTAEDLGLTLCSFSRTERLSIYCHPERVAGTVF